MYRQRAAVPLAVAPQVSPQLHLMPATEMSYRCPHHALPVGPAKKTKAESHIGRAHYYPDHLPNLPKVLSIPSLPSRDNVQEGLHSTFQVFNSPRPNPGGARRPRQRRSFTAPTGQQKSYCVDRSCRIIYSPHRANRRAPADT